MANIKSAEKRIRVIEKKTEINRGRKTELKTLIKKYAAAPTADGLSIVVSNLDRAAADNIIHANKANRLKARYSQLLTAKKA